MDVPKKSPNTFVSQSIHYAENAFLLVIGVFTVVAMAQEIWIMDDSTGNAICLGIAGDARGKVYFWDQEREPDLDETDGTIEGMGNISILAHTFATFFAGLQLAARV